MPQRGSNCRKHLALRNREREVFRLSETKRWERDLREPGHGTPRKGLYPAGGGISEGKC